MTRYWLMKSEPSVVGIDDVLAMPQQTVDWWGVRNYQARNFMMKEMKVGDGILFYHSNCAVPGVVGLAEVVSDAYPDPTQFQKKSDYYDAASKPEQPRWWMVDVGFVRRFKRTVSLDALRAEVETLGEEFPLLRRGNRLSVLPVTAPQYKHILSLE